MGLIGPWEGVYNVAGFGDCELEVQCKGMVFYDGDQGLEVPDFRWTLEGAEVSEEAAATLVDHWDLEGLFLEDVWANLYTADTVKVGERYRLDRGSPARVLPTVVEVLAVCKLRNEIRWQVVAKDVHNIMACGAIHLMPVCDFYLPGYAVAEDEDGPRYKLVEEVDGE